jgi:hypothetical protein
MRVRVLFLTARLRKNKQHLELQVVAERIRDGPREAVVDEVEDGHAPHAGDSCRTSLADRIEPDRSLERNSSQRVSHSQIRIILSESKEFPMCSTTPTRP